MQLNFINEFAALALGEQHSAIDVDIGTRHKCGLIGCGKDRQIGGIFGELSFALTTDNTSGVPTKVLAIFPNQSRRVRQPSQKNRN